MNFTVTTHEGMKEIHWFKDVDALVTHMLLHPKDRYWRMK